MLHIYSKPGTLNLQSEDAKKTKKVKGIFFMLRNLPQDPLLYMRINEVGEDGSIVDNSTKELAEFTHEEWSFFLAAMRGQVYFTAAISPAVAQGGLAAVPYLIRDLHSGQCFHIATIAEFCDPITGFRSVQPVRPWDSAEVYTYWHNLKPGDKIPRLDPVLGKQIQKSFLDSIPYADVRGILPRSVANSYVTATLAESSKSLEDLDHGYTPTLDPAKVEQLIKDSVKSRRKRLLAGHLEQDTQGIVPARGSSMVERLKSRKPTRVLMAAFSTQDRSTSDQQNLPQGDRTAEAIPSSLAESNSTQHASTAAETTSTALQPLDVLGNPIEGLTRENLPKGCTLNLQHQLQDKDRNVYDPNLHILETSRGKFKAKAKAKPATPATAKAETAAK